MKRKLFGISSERTARQFDIRGQLSLFDTDANSQEAEPEMIQIVSHTKRKPRATHDEIAKNVPATVVNLTLEGDDLNCPYCNTPMVEIGTKTVREEIKITPAKVERVIYLQHNYVCPQAGRMENQLLCRLQFLRHLFHTAWHRLRQYHMSCIRNVSIVCHSIVRKKTGNSWA